MNLTERKSLTGPLLIVALFISVVATLRYAQEFFLPLVLAGLLSFLLSPLVRRLERWHLSPTSPRPASHPMRRTHPSAASRPATKAMKSPR